MNIVIDDREKNVIKYFDLFSNEFPMVSYEVNRLYIGDYALVTSTGNVVLTVERKTMSDLGASLVDRRVENLEKQLSFRNENHCVVMYLIESDRAYLEKGMLTHLFRRMFERGVHVMFTRDMSDTARLMFEMADVAGKCDCSPFTGVLDTFKQKPVVSENQILLKCWMACPYVTVNNIGEVGKRSICETMQLSELDVKHGKTILTNLRKSSVQMKMLVSIDGVSKDKARVLLSGRSLLDLAKMPVEEMSEIQVGKRKLGKCVAGRVHSTLNTMNK